jgi:hypothetical protein
LPAQAQTGARKVIVADPQAEERLLAALRGKPAKKGELVRVTRADAVAMTGMPSDQAEPALKSLVKSYRSHVAVTDEGELVYAFDPSLERRDRVPLGERVRTFGRALWKGFQFLFKIWIVVTLVVYVVAFIAMMLALVFARSSDDRDDHRGGGGDGMFWLWFWLMPDMAPPGYYERRGRQRPKRTKRFYLSVFDFVFGPKQAPVDPRESDKRLLAFLRDHKGRVTAAELVALTGLTYERADEEMTRLMVEYDGEVEVADDGTLIYVFKDILPSASSADTWWSWVWDRSTPPQPLTGNTPGTDAAVGGLAGFNLIASLTIAPAFLMRFGLESDPIAAFFTTWFPLAFSSVFFAVPGVRWLVKRRRDKKLARAAIRRELLREVWEHPNDRFDPEVVAARIAERTGQPKELARKQLDKLLAELDGEVDTDAEGRMRYRFDRLAAERKAIEGARAQVRQLPTLGSVVFTSEDERPESS